MRDWLHCVDYGWVNDINVQNALEARSLKPLGGLPLVRELRHTAAALLRPSLSHVTAAAATHSTESTHASSHSPFYKPRFSFKVPCSFSSLRQKSKKHCARARASLKRSVCARCFRNPALGDAGARDRVIGGVSRVIGRGFQKQLLCE